MPHKCPIKHAACCKQWRLDNIEKVKQDIKQWRLDNIEKVKQDKKQYNQSDNGKKIQKIGIWKHRGIITDDYEFLYEWYNSINNCLNCGVDLINGTGVSNHKHLDHDHTTGEPCMVVCGHCNINILK